MRLTRQIPAFPKHPSTSNKGASAAPPSYGIDFVDRGLPGDLRSGLEFLSGFDLSDVRVHKNSDKPAELGAVAYAQGSDIYLSAGGERHLPHEAWHVVQQKQGRVTAARRIGGLAANDDHALEAEADTMGARAARRTVGVDTARSRSRSQPAAVVQRKLLPVHGFQGRYTESRDIPKDYTQPRLMFTEQQKPIYYELQTKQRYQYFDQSDQYQLLNYVGYYFDPNSRSTFYHHIDTNLYYRYSVSTNTCDWNNACDYNGVEYYAWVAPPEPEDQDPGDEAENCARRLERFKRDITLGGELTLRHAIEFLVTSTEKHSTAHDFTAGVKSLRARLDDREDYKDQGGTDLMHRKAERITYQTFMELLTAWKDPGRRPEDSWNAIQIESIRAKYDKTEEQYQEELLKEQAQQQEDENQGKTHSKLPGRTRVQGGHTKVPKITKPNQNKKKNQNKDKNKKKKTK